MREQKIYIQTQNKETSMQYFQFLHELKQTAGWKLMETHLTEFRKDIEEDIFSMTAPSSELKYSEHDYLKLQRHLLMCLLELPDLMMQKLRDSEEGQKTTELDPFEIPRYSRDNNLDDVQGAVI